MLIQSRGVVHPGRRIDSTRRALSMTMVPLIAIGFLGGLITGISPCILPVLPVIFFSGTQSARDSDGGGVATEAPPTRAQTLRPYLVIAGLVLSFSIVTLVGSALLSLLHLPDGAV